MKTTIALLLLASATFACTKQPSQKPQVDSEKTDGRTDVSEQSGTITNPDNTGKEAVTTNPNSAREGKDSTLGTSQGASVVGDANMNPSSTTPTPTSVDTPSAEPKTDAAVDRVNCLDGNSGPECPPTAQSPMKAEDTTKNAPR